MNSIERRVATLAEFAAVAAAGLVLGPEMVIKPAQVVTEAKTTPSTPADRQKPNLLAEQLKAIMGSGRRFAGKQGRRAGYGWTNAHAKRVAEKKRRVKAHRSRA